MQTLTRTSGRSIAMAALAATLLIAGPLAGPASAACHVAGFFSTPYETSEAQGSIDITIVLQGRQPSCAGTIDYTTVDGTAIAGEDYEAASGTLTYELSDDREETFTVTILADDVAEGAEEFFIELSNPTEGITGQSGPATVTIAADEDANVGGGDATPAAEDDDADASAADDSGSFPVIPFIVGLVVLLGVGAVLAGRRK